MSEDDLFRHQPMREQPASGPTEWRVVSELTGNELWRCATRLEAEAFARYRTRVDVRVEEVK